MTHNTDLVELRFLKVLLEESGRLLQESLGLTAVVGFKERERERENGKRLVSLIINQKKRKIRPIKLLHPRHNGL